MLVCIMLFCKAKAQPISPNFFGQNAWYTVYTDIDIIPDTDNPFVKYINEVKASGAKFCRIGGANANILGNFSMGVPSNIPITKEQILYLVKKIRAAGMEAIIQVPYLNPGNDNMNLISESQNAGVIVDFINNVNLIAIGGTPVENWIIANEPDKDMDSGYRIGYNYNEFAVTSPTEIAEYVKQFSIEMRKSDPTIKIIGPELAFPWMHFFRSGLYPAFDMVNSFDGLLDGATNDISGLIPTNDPYGASTGAGYNKPYVDYISFHYYGTSTTRSTVINNIHSTLPNKIKDVLTSLSSDCNAPSMLAKRNNGTMTYPLKIALTESNLVATGADPDAIPNSFLRGQWWCDFMGVCLSKNTDISNFWSSTETSFGAMESDGTIRPTYWHYKLMADYFKSGTAGPGYTNSFFEGTESVNNFKVFGANVNGKSQSVVMLLNQEHSTMSPVTYDYTINLNGTVSGSGANTPITIGFSMGITGTVPPAQSGTIAPETTQLLVFDCGGRYTGMWEYNITDAMAGTPPRWIDNPAFFGGLGITNNYSGAIIPPNGTVNIAFYGATTFTWMPQTGLTINYNTNTDGSDVTLTAPGTAGQTTYYIYTATAPDGCMTTEVIGVTANGYVVGLAPEGTITSVNSTCAGAYADGSASVTITTCPNYPGCYVTWANAGGVSIGSGLSISGLIPGIYYATIHDPGNSFDPPTSTVLRTTINSDFNQFNTITGNSAHPDPT
ncbi:MAG: hypothetical protein M3R27_06975 [Bacteroidota bacterium]|nr:hypothetical protein [Bacteroidota bacterium]